MGEETLILGIKGEWIVPPHPVCKVSGSIYHETCVLGGDRVEYPCCDIVYVMESIEDPDA